MPKFQVTVEFVGESTVIVDAPNERAALHWAKTQGPSCLDDSPPDYDWDAAEVQAVPDEQQADTGPTKTAGVVLAYLLECQLGASVPVIARALHLSEDEVGDAIDDLVREEAVRMVRRTKTSEVYGVVPL